MQVNNLTLLLLSISNQNEQGSVILRDTVVDQMLDAAVERLSLLLFGHGGLLVWSSGKQCGLEVLVQDEEGVFIFFVSTVMHFKDVTSYTRLQPRRVRH